MAASSPFGSQDITLEKNKVITVTKRTVRFSRNVYQTHNIAGFGEGEVDIGTISWGLIIVAFIFGLILNSFNIEVGWLLVLAGIAGGVWNFFKPKHYGFLLTLNSGDKKLFVTTDQAGLKQVISVVYEFIETEKDATYQISINNSQVKGNFIQGNAKDVLFNSDDDSQSTKF
ncbi:DUF6232 family protein [Oscillatoria sp. CS-180]|uniref:DUF6232 family protein n=1 Tax=Oscillatoria sp. CS-180 TaxID=3021720 RepID=UPI00232D9B4E|nr:DUF6232 family protein [Oscillatoria sp. CS-180]MDB9526541.1 DUF6232 family protein [Oscillatoria sp. CS-180]